MSPTSGRLDRITDELRKTWPYIDIDAWYGEPRDDHREEWRLLVADFLAAIEAAEVPTEVPHEMPHRRGLME